MWAAAWASDIKWTDAAIVLFTFGQVWVGIRQARIAREQTRIAAKTREIAVAALGRPYIFVEEVSHSLDRPWWQTGRELEFHFRLTNLGGGPAVIKQVRGDVFFSFGPRSRIDERDDLIRTFIRAGDYDAWADRRWRPADALEPRERGGPFILKPGATSGRFEMAATAKLPAFGTPAGERLRRLYGIENKAAPWLAVRVLYKTPFGTVHHTNHCARGRTDGGADTYDERLHTERT